MNNTQLFVSARPKSSNSKTDRKKLKAEQYKIMKRMLTNEKKATEMLEDQVSKLSSKLKDG